MINVIPPVHAKSKIFSFPSMTKLAQNTRRDRDVVPANNAGRKLGNKGGLAEDSARGADDLKAQPAECWAYA
jgi:hypothetical protein